MIPAQARPRRWIRRLLLLAAAAGLYPLFVFGVVYVDFFRSGLPGGRHGPADAYRHSLAGAVVAYSLSPRCVDWVTQVMEHGGRGNASRAMDGHNNRIGARIGAAATDWNAMRQAVLAAVGNGAVNARSPDQITWLAPSEWQERLY